MLNEQTDRKLRSMKLAGMADAYNEQSRQVTMAELSFDERFGLLVDRQWTYRENRTLQTRLKLAKFKLSA
ncbi:MAG: ATP-binding protein, partial [bacterium]